MAILKYSANIPHLNFAPSDLLWTIQSLYVQDIVGRLTLDEMVAQMSHGGANRNGKGHLLAFFLNMDGQ